MIHVMGYDITSQLTIYLVFVCLTWGGFTSQIAIIQWERES